MNKLIFPTCAFLIVSACSRAPQGVAVETNNATIVNQSQATTVAGHSSEKSFPPGQVPAVPDASVVPRSETKTKWTQSGNPIDTAKFDADIAKAEKDLKAKNSDAAKKTLAAAYIERAAALTDARQYASALGDYRKASKLDQNNPEAKEWVDKIISIYDSINRAYPPEGEEPPALPFKKDGKPELN